MKRTAMDHSKMKRLVRLLHLPRYAIVGILESLWHLTAREAPRGNIGKLCNEDIAAWIDWEGDADELVKHLVTSGWLDYSNEDRLVVHDWTEHADDTTKKAMSRQKEKEAATVQTSPDVEGQNTPALPCLALPEPSPALPKPVLVKPPKTPEATEFETPLPAWLPSEDWSAYVETRKALKKPLTSRAAELRIAEFQRKYDEGWDMLAMLHLMIASGWLNLVEEKLVKRPVEWVEVSDYDTAAALFTAGGGL